MNLTGLEILGMLTIVISITVAIIILIILLSETIRDYRNKRQAIRVFELEEYLTNDRKVLIKERNKIDKLLAQIED